MSRIQTLLTISYDFEINRNDALEFGRNIASNLSAKPGVASVRMQLFVGDPLTDKQSREIAEQ